MTGNTTRRAKRTGKRIGFKIVTVAIIFLGLLMTFEELAAALNIAQSSPSVIAMAGFLAGIAAERYVI